MIKFEKTEITLKNDIVLTIKIADPSDAQGILNYLEIVSGETANITFGPGEFGKSVESEQKYLQSMNRNKTDLMIVGLIQDEIVALGDINGSSRPRISKVADIAITVQKKYWGIGVGTSMMNSLINWGRNYRQLRKINLSVREDNIRAIHLYEKLGFIKEGISSRGMFINNSFINLIFMGLEID